MTAPTFDDLCAELLLPDARRCPYDGMPCGSERCRGTCALDQQRAAEVQP